MTSGIPLETYVGSSPGLLQNSEIEADEWIYALRTTYTELWQRV